MSMPFIREEGERFDATLQAATGSGSARPRRAALPGLIFQTLEAIRNAVAPASLLVHWG